MHFLVRKWTEISLSFEYLKIIRDSSWDIVVTFIWMVPLSNFIHWLTIYSGWFWEGILSTKDDHGENTPWSALLKQLSMRFIWAREFLKGIPGIEVSNRCKMLWNCCDIKRSLKSPQATDGYLKTSQMGVETTVSEWMMVTSFIDKLWTSHRWSRFNAHFCHQIIANRGWLTVLELHTSANTSKPFHYQFIYI